MAWPDSELWSALTGLAIVHWIGYYKYLIYLLNLQFWCLNLHDKIHILVFQDELTKEKLPGASFSFVKNIQYLSLLATL